MIVRINRIVFLCLFINIFRIQGIEVRVVKRGEYNEDTVRWADAIVSAGGKSLCADELEGKK